MLIQIDKNELGDQRLNEIENLAKLKEGNAKLTEKLKPADQADLEDQMKAMGQPMGWNQLVFLIQKINPSVICEDGGMANAIAVRIPAWQEDGTYGKKYVTGFYKDVLPEFSSVTTDERGVATREKRGWRTVVVALIKQGVITYKNAVDVFGEPNGQRAGRWQQLLRNQRS